MTKFSMWKCKKDAHKKWICIMTFLYYSHSNKCFICPYVIYSLYWQCVFTYVVGVILFNNDLFWCQGCSLFSLISMCLVESDNTKRNPKQCWRIPNNHNEVKLFLGFDFKEKVRTTWQWRSVVSIHGWSSNNRSHPGYNPW